MRLPWVFKGRTSKTLTVAFAIAIVVGLGLKFGGSFVPVLVEMQPARFLLPTFALMSLPAAMTANWICDRMRVPDVIGVAALTVTLLGLTQLRLDGDGKSGRTHTDFAGRTQVEKANFLSLPGAVPQPGGFDELIEFIRRSTSEGDRLLVQTRIQAEQTILAHHLDREIIGNAYPNTADQSNFLLERLWGQPVDQWQTQPFLDALRRWNVRWVLVHRKSARLLCDQALGNGEPVGPYHAYQVEFEGKDALSVRASVRASVNRLEISVVEAKDDVLVVPYRYHPAFYCEQGCELVRHSIPEDPLGFIAIRDPKPSMTLLFSPAAYFSETWPLPWNAASGSEGTITQQENSTVKTR